LAVLFAYLLLRKVELLTRNKRLALLCVSVLLALLGWASVHFTRQALVGLPEVVNNSLPSMLGYLEAHGVPIPFASPRLLWRMKMVTHREKDAGDLVFLRHWFAERGEQPPAV
jgi:hypothetical protein